MQMSLHGDQAVHWQDPSDAFECYLKHLPNVESIVIVPIH